jgi:hypothetical protein
MLFNNYGMAQDQGLHGIFMSDNTTPSEWDFDYTDHTDRRLITDISRTITSMSNENRAKRRRQRLREDLVREHIEDKQRPGSHLKSIFQKLFKS